MKLLFAIKRLSEAVGGAERVFCTVCSNLAADGHDVTVLTFDHPNRATFYPLNSRVKRIDLGIGAAAAAAGLFETFRRIRELRRVVLVDRPEVAVGFMHSMFVPMAFALMGTGIPVLGSEHIVPEHYRTRPFQFVLLMAAAPFLARMTVLSEAIRLRYPSFVRRRMVVMPNPIEVAPFRPAVVDIKAEYTILSVGRFEEQKDHATLLYAFAHLEREFPEWRLRIVGDGLLRSKLEALIKKLNLTTRVALPGVMADIAKEYIAADLFVIPSRYEAFGLVTAEAMSHGLAVVGFADCPGTNELIEDSRTGFLVETDGDRALALAHSLRGLLANSFLRRNLGLAGRDAIAKHLNPQRVCEKWMFLLNLVVRSRALHL
jgi:glycosyltransferase involved in cell wall biosynthesis